MADRNSTGQPPAFLPSIPIRPSVIRGRLFFEIGPVLFPSFAQAATAWSAVQAEQGHIADQLDALTVQRAVALVEMRGAGDDLARFATASKHEAHLAAQIRHVRRQGGAR